MVNVLKRSPCDTGQNTSVVPDVHIQPLYLLGTKAQTILFNEPGDIAVRQTEDKAEASGVRFPLIRVKQYSRRFFQKEYSGSCASVSKNLSVYIRQCGMC